jgi:parallel beta-helix repeat protein
MATGRTIVVAQHGPSDASTIGAGIAMARDGDIVLVRPGVYVEDVVINDDIALRGDGPLGAVVLSSVDSGPAIRLLDSDGRVSDLVLRGRGSAIVASGGTPVIERLGFEAGRMKRGANLPDVAIQLEGGTVAVVRDNVLTHSGEIRLIEDAVAVVESNTLRDGHGIAVEDAGDGTLIRDNVIERAFLHGIAVRSKGRPVIEDNVIRGAESNGISVGAGHSAGVDPLVRGNTVSDSSFGITVSNLADPLVAGNVLDGNDVGISTAVSDATIISNVIRDGGVGIAATRHAPRLEGNVIKGNVIGILVRFATAPRLARNQVCGNETNLWLAAGVPQPPLHGDHICPTAFSGGHVSSDCRAHFARPRT